MGPCACKGLGSHASSALRAFFDGRETSGHFISALAGAGQKGREKMTIFADTAAFLGTAELPDEAVRRFFAETARLGSQLGKGRALLDAYLLCLLRLTAREQAAEWAVRGETAMRSFRLRAGEPLSLLDSLESSRADADRQLRKERQELRRCPEWLAMEKIYPRLAELLHGEAELEPIECLFARIFLREKAATFFVRGVLEDLMMSLSSPGDNGGPPLLRKIIDAV